MYRMKRKTTQMTKGAKERHHTAKSYHNYAKVYGKQNILTNIKLYLGSSKHELDYSYF